MSRPRTDAQPIDRLVDWEFAVRTAQTLTRPGPQVSAAQAAEVVSELRQAAADATPHVSRVTELPLPVGGQVLVVDRPGWARINAQSFRTLLAPAVADAFAAKDRPPGGPFAAVGSRVTGAEVGALLGILSARVLGQYDAFGEVAGRLILVAPTIVAVERDLGVNVHDFRLWVCLHEETHRLQFTANPWLADHLAGEVRGMVGDLLAEPSELADRLGGIARSLPDLLRGKVDDTSTGSLLDIVGSPEQRRRLARVTAVMSLLEGHADVVMDDVGPEVVPTVAQIRSRFTKRRKGKGAVDQLLRRLLGLDAKARQYADGAKFVRGVVDRVGMSGFNAVWASPETLPSPEEIADPIAWVRRVHA